MGTAKTDNELIAEFMELKRQNRFYFYNKEVTDTIHVKDLKYHSSWDDLMDVLKKIWSMVSDDAMKGYSTERLLLFRDLQENGLCSLDIKITFQKAVNCIKSLNQ